MLQAARTIRSAISMLNPEHARQNAEQPLTVGLAATGSAGFAEMEDFLAPAGISHDQRTRIMERIHRAGDPGAPERVDLLLCEPGMPLPPQAYQFRRDDPGRTIEEILDHEVDLRLALASQLPVFRRPAVDRIVHAIARENALFALASALPNVVPNLLELPWSVGEFASDTAFLTLNQVRMAFLIAAACGKPVGFKEQKTEIASIAAGAFGWRALARELVGFIPLGGGLIPKGAIAYAGTYVIGKGIEHFHSVGAFYPPAERRAVYGSAYERGKALMESFLGTRGRSAA